MKNLVLLISLLVLSACTVEPTNTLIPTKSVFLTKAEIFQEVKIGMTAKHMDSPLTSQEMERMGNLIDPKVFFGEQAARKIKSYKNIKFLGVGEVDLRDRDTSVKSQDNGKCSAYAGVAALENTMNRDKKIEGLDLSEWDAWSHYGQYSCDAFIKTISKQKVCDEKLYPQYGKDNDNCKKNAYAMLADYKYIDSDVAAMVKALDSGNVVYLGMSTPTDIVKCKKVISPTSSNSGGGHAMLITGYYKDNGQVIAILKNSWGSDCGDSGYHYMPMSLCSKSGFYCVMWDIRKVTVDASAPVPTPEDPSCKKWKTIWWKPWAKKCIEWS